MGDWRHGVPWRRRVPRIEYHQNVVPPMAGEHGLGAHLGFERDEELRLLVARDCYVNSALGHPSGGFIKTSGSLETVWGCQSYE